MNQLNIKLPVVFLCSSLFLLGCSSNSANSPELFTKGELMAFDETGRAPRYIPPTDVISESTPTQMANATVDDIADEMKIEGSSGVPVAKGDDPVAIIIAADEERKKVQKEDEEAAQSQPINDQVEVAAVTVTKESVEEGELPIDQSYWKPRPEEVLSDISSSSGVKVAMSRPSDNAENFKVSRGSSARLSKWFVLNAPKRLVLDFDDVVGNGFSTKHVLPMDSKYVSEVRVGSYEGRSRVVLDIASPDCIAEVLSGQNAEEVEISLKSDARG